MSMRAFVQSMMDAAMNSNSRRRRSMLERNSSSIEFQGIMRDLYPFYMGGKLVLMASRAFARQLQNVTSRQAYRRNKRKIDRANQAMKKIEGRLGSVKDAVALGLVGGEQELGGSYLGCLDGVPVWNRSDKHEMIVGLAGSGKTTTIAYPKIIGLALGSNPESVVCIDIKGELWGSTAQGRAKLDGVEPIVINPWGLHGVPSSRFNIFEDLKMMAKAKRPIKDAVLAKIRMIHPPLENKGANEWIASAAMRLSSCVLAHLVEVEPDRANPAIMADIGVLNQSEFVDLMSGLKSSPACGGWVSDVASKLLDQYGYAEDPKYFEWIFEEYATAWEMFGKGSVLREETYETDFDFTELKRDPRAVYFMVPPRYLVSHGKYVALLLDVLIDIIAAARGPVRTSFICDEFVNIPKAKSTVQALRLFRSYGIRLVVFAQDREGFSKYKDEGGYKPFEENSIGLYWGIRDGSHMRDIQERAGHRYSLVSGVNASIGERVNSGGDNAGLQRVPVLSIDEIGQIADGQAILEIPGQRLFIVERPFSQDLPFCSGLVRDLRNDPLPDIDHL